MKKLLSVMLAVSMLLSVTVIGITKSSAQNKSFKAVYDSEYSI